MLKIMDTLLEVFAWHTGIFGCDLPVWRIKMRPVNVYRPLKKCVCFWYGESDLLMVCQ